MCVWTKKRGSMKARALRATSGSPADEEERRWFVLERPRRDTNGGSETEVTVTSKLEKEVSPVMLVRFRRRL